MILMRHQIYLNYRRKIYEMDSTVQAVIFPLSFGIARARRWLKKHHYFPIKHGRRPKCIISKNKIKYRIKKPIYEKYFITILEDDIQLICGLFEFI